MIRPFIAFWLLGVLVVSCAPGTPAILGPVPSTPSALPAPTTSASACPLTKPVWATPPEDSAVEGSPEPGYYFVNADHSIWASAWWMEPSASPLRVNAEGIKVGWFRPAGATLNITGQRIDALAAPLEAHIPCCYPTRFQATGLIFPTEGCWEVTARAADRELSFVVQVEP